MNLASRIQLKKNYKKKYFQNIFNTQDIPLENETGFIMVITKKHLENPTKKHLKILAKIKFRL